MRFLTLALTALLAGAAAATSNAATIISDNFDGYADQAAFEASWPLSGTSNSLTSAQSVSAPNSIQQNAGTTTLNIKTFSASTATDLIATNANPVEWSFMFYDDPSNLPVAGNTLGRSYGQLQGRLQSDGSLSQVISMGLWNANIPKASNGVTSTTAELRQYYAARVAFIGPNWVLLDTGPVRSAGWHELKATLGDTTVQFSVDGIAAATYNYAASAGVTGFYNARIGSGVSSNALVAYDNYSLAQVPEPSTLALIVLGFCGVAASGRRRPC
jgi:hypothetical protein